MAEDRFEKDTEGWDINPLLPSSRREELKTKSYYDKVDEFLDSIYEVYYESSNHSLKRFIMNEYRTFKETYEAVKGRQTASTLDTITTARKQIQILLRLYEKYLNSRAYITEDTRDKVGLVMRKLRELLNSYNQLFINFYL